MSCTNYYLFQFPFYAVAMGSEYANALETVIPFDSKEAATDYIENENKTIQTEEYDSDESKWRDDPCAIEWLLLNPQELHELGSDSKYFLYAIEADLFKGRYCSIELSHFIKLAFGKQTVFAKAQSVQPAQVTQWINKNACVTFEDGRWVLRLPRREILL